MNLTVNGDRQFTSTRLNLVATFTQELSMKKNGSRFFDLGSNKFSTDELKSVMQQPMMAKDYCAHLSLPKALGVHADVSVKRSV
ncbi:hypothetical protein TNCV_1306251 [Trichonephila clavipes]|nr:hypothetical protein TNCV_1306251 [Trichonephila clavipes]